MPLFYDQLNRPVELKTPPRRIISLVPSQTELLFDLGLADHVVGITKFCIHPAYKVKSVTKVGGTKQVDMQIIKRLQPDLIICNKEENERAQVEELIEHYPVWISDINDLPTAIDMIAGIGEIAGTHEAARQLSTAILERFSALKPVLDKRRVMYLIWRKPYMAAGSGTFIDSMLQLCGLNNVITTGRYPEVSVDEMISSDPEVLLLSSEPYPFAQKHIAELQALLPNTVIELVDGELFSWYGSRLLHSAGYLESLSAKLTAK